MVPTTLLEGVNAQHGTSFALMHRYPHGESGSGAYAVMDAAGRQGVLKWVPDVTRRARLHAIAAITARLRTRGYPAPRYVAVGCWDTVCYTVYERLPGIPLQSVPRDLVPHLIHLNKVQRGQALPGRRDWPHAIIGPVLYGGDGFCLLEPLRTYAPVTAALLHTLQAIVAQHHAARYVTGDVVHFDFNPTNILMHHGEISGVIDWQGPQAGDCTFDLVTLLFYAWDTPDTRDLLWQYASARVGPAVLSVYLAHLILRQVDWSIRHHGPQATTRWLRIAQEILGRCAAVEHT